MEYLSGTDAGQDELLVLPVLRAGLEAGGRYRLTRKFIDGMAQFAAYWPGKVTLLLKMTHHDDDNLDHCVVDGNDLPFHIELWPEGKMALRNRLRQAAVVLATLSGELLHLTRDCTAVGTAVVWIAETSLLTRCQIIDATVGNSLRRYKRKGVEWLRELNFRRAIAAANGIQCNGTPTFAAYRDLTPHPFLFFDSRVGAEQIASDAALERRIGYIHSGAPLRLAFSGRLISIKGVDDLPLVANELRRRGVPFSLDIYGGGEREAALRGAITRLGLGDQVRLGGVLDFDKQLVPTMREEVDLFICCHVQGDPACTYLETLACGTPIVGYNNEAWRGLANESKIGWVTPCGRPAALAAQIDALHRDRAALAHAVAEARDFAAQHTFEQTMRRRVAHLLSASGKGKL